MKLLEDPEALDLIEVIKKSVVKSSKKKLYARLAGSISSKQAENMRNKLREMRNEWERNI